MTDIEFSVSSGNVFYDIGIKDFNAVMCRSSCLILIARLIKEQRLTQMQTAEILGVNQPKVSRLLNGYGKGFSLEKLFEFLQKLGCVVSVEVKKL